MEAARSHNPQLGVLAADTLAAVGDVLTARAMPNPALTASYSKSLPRYHVTADFPLEFIWRRTASIQSADRAQRASRLQFTQGVAALVLHADTSYTVAIASRARLQLSRRTAMAADSLRRIAVARLAVGDVSELDVELATIEAGQAANAAATDSLAFVAALLDLQAAIGLPSDRVMVAVVDSLTAPDSVGAPAVDSTLMVRQARAVLASAAFALDLQRRSLFDQTSVSVGFESGDPTGAEPGVLPTIGFSIPIPLMDRKRGPILAAVAARLRAASQLIQVRLEVANAIAHAVTEQSAARERLTRDRVLMASANRVTAMSLTAYREGAIALASVFEAQRSARGALRQYVDDLASASIAAATLRMLAAQPSESGGMP